MENQTIQDVNQNPGHDFVLNVWMVSEFLDVFYQARMLFRNSRRRTRSDRYPLAVIMLSGFVITSAREIFLRLPDTSLEGRGITFFVIFVKGRADRLDSRINLSPSDGGHAFRM